MADEMAAVPPPQSRLEAAEIRAWRADRVRRLPRRARILAWRLVAVCVCALLVLGALGEVVPLLTTTVAGGLQSDVPHQK